MQKIFDFENVNSEFKRLFEQVRAKKSCSIFGVQNSMRPAISSFFGKKIVYVTADSVVAKSRAENFEILGLKTLTLEAVQDTFLYKRASSNEIFLNRTKTLVKILSNDFDVLVVPILSLFSFLPSVSDFKANITRLKAGQNLDMLDLEKRLTQAGYKREELVFEMGQFARRGDVFDIFPVGASEPRRIEFFDTEIESIKILDLQTQRGTKQENSLEIFPFTDLFLSDTEVRKIIGELENFKAKLYKNENALSAVTCREVDEIISRLELGDRGYSLDLLSSFLDDFRSTIFDYLASAKSDFLVVYDEAKQIFDSLVEHSKEFQERTKELQNSGTLIAENRPLEFTKNEVLATLKNQPSVAFLKLTNSNKFFESDAVFSFKTAPVSRYVHSLKEFVMDAKAYTLRGYKIVIFAGSAEQARTAGEILASSGLDGEIQKVGAIFSAKIKNNIVILKQAYSNGFILNDEKIFVVGTYDIFPKKRASNSLKVSRENVFSIPKVGDYVVHHYHGIGICEGVTQLTTLGTKDYVVIRYAGGDLLYVPTTNLDMLDRFSGAEKPAKLSPIGGPDFANVKNKVKQSLKKLAINLVELYAKRESLRGFAFSKDNDLQYEFENSFPYTETEDQLKSIDEIKKDMESGKVMDRLVCGDVGFGKTEVALRACFKAIADGKQVAFVAPTTILSEQHYNTARARMFDFGVNIEVLNRFKTTAQTKKILEDLSLGKIDMLCGTHKIFGKDVEFKNLGLIVLDEEQKFGVEDKEKLKVKYPNVDVLTLSATPIPRTLSMSLSGIRDISLISTPPSERLPIQTYVVEFENSLVRDAILREKARDGQVFILFNSVEHIYYFADTIKKLVPEASILVAHGQMSSKMLENTIFDFYHKKADVLVCTTIIENGIDIENANTLIVCDSDKLGLSSLYQIRGRVGRGSRMAYAYFTYSAGKALTEEAYKRLDAISEFCEFGSGFKLAMRDLEIRGGGNILGAEQSGHLQKIGYDMYSKLLADAVKEAKGEVTTEQRDVLVKVELDAFVSENYISTSEDRMVAYKRISAVDSVLEEEKLKLELLGTYGKIPEETANLISISFVRNLSRKFGAFQIQSSGVAVEMLFDDGKQITESEIFGEAIFKFRLKCSLDLAKVPLIRFSKGKTVKENFEDLKEFLLILENESSKKETSAKK